MTPHHVTFACFGLICCNQLVYGYQATIRYTDLVKELTLRELTIPDGTGVSVTQVETPVSGALATDFMPNFGDAEFAGKTITDKSGGGISSSHATNVGRNLYGLTSSIAPGISTVDVYQSSDWLNNQGWRTGVPITEPNPLQSHSWVGFSSNNNATARMDFAVERDNFLPIAGLYNSDFGDQNISSDIPEIYGSMYNGITVGVSDGTHRTGVTSASDGPGRIKPEIVAPNAFTSFATPYVTAAAAMLIESSAVYNADTYPQQVLKAILLAGANKSPFADWDQTILRPLDDIYGAGQLDVYESYFIQKAGQQTAGSTIDTRGWNLGNLSSSNSEAYTIHIPSGFTLRMLSVLVTWNRQVTKREFYLFTRFTPAALADISLELTDNSNSSTVQNSDSAVDNIEHIWRGSGSELTAGNYTLTVATDAAVTYALAWRSELYQDYTLWSSTAFTTTPLADQDPTDDPDKDGINNLLEQAFGGDPETNYLGILPISETVEDVGLSYLQISYRRPSFENGLTYTVETVTDLNGTWSSQSSEVELISIATEVDGFDRYTFRRVDPISEHEKAFLRVSISQ